MAVMINNRSVRQSIVILGLLGLPITSIALGIPYSTKEIQNGLTSTPERARAKWHELRIVFGDLDGGFKKLLFDGNRGGLERR